jgi:hypothetical protein
MNNNTTTTPTTTARSAARTAYDRAYEAAHAIYWDCDDRYPEIENAARIEMKAAIKIAYNNYTAEIQRINRNCP